MTIEDNRSLRKGGRAVEEATWSIAKGCKDLTKA